MIKKTKTKVFDTDTASVLKKATYGEFGDPAGYEETLYQTPEGDYFMYTNGGPESPYKGDKIASACKAKALEMLK